MECFPGRTRKSGGIFSMDAILAIFIISIGFYIFFIDVDEDNVTKEAKIISDEILDLLENIKVKDICSGQVMHPECTCMYPQVMYLYCNGDISGDELSMLELIGELYEKGRVDEITNILNETIRQSQLIPANYEYFFSLDYFEGGNVRTVKILQEED